jgi:hypothetical protein
MSNLLNRFRPPIQNNPLNTFQPYGSNNYLAGTQDFLKSNSIIAKISFLLLVLFLFMLALRLGIALLGWIFNPSISPTLIDGMIDSKEMHIISQNPETKGNIPILRSKNEQGGIEFTWSVWVYINNLTYKNGQYRHIFHKGNDKLESESSRNGMITPNNAPGLYIGPNTNNLVVVMNTFENVTEEITIDNIPIKKWVNVILRCNGNILDIFVNGTLTRRHILNSVPKQNYGDVYISMNGGFDGNTSNLKYFGYAIGTNNIQQIMRAGPNLTMISDTLTPSSSGTNYLALRWHFSDSNAANV